MRLLKGCAEGIHKFEARYDKGPVAAEFQGLLSGYRLELMEKYRKHTYVRDVCIRCGKTIERLS